MIHIQPVNVQFPEDEPYEITVADLKYVIDQITKDFPDDATVYMRTMKFDIVKKDN